MPRQNGGFVIGGELMLYGTFVNQQFSEVSSPLTPHFEACDDHLELSKLPWVCIQLLESSSGADAVIRPGT